MKTCLKAFACCFLIFNVVQSSQAELPQTCTLELQPTSLHANKVSIKVETNLKRDIVSELERSFGEKFENLKEEIKKLHEKCEYSKTELFPDSCEQALRDNCNKSGIYKLFLPESTLPPFSVYCKCDGQEIWTVIQRREDGSMDFYRDWADYKNGFGFVYGEFWLGLEKIHQLVKNHAHELKIWVKNDEGEEKIARYKKFLLADESEKYKMTVGSYSGNAGNDLNFPGYVQNGMKFSTRDNRNDNWTVKPCAEKYRGGWWFNACTAAHLNGPYVVDNIDTRGVHWHSVGYKLKYSQMAIRRI